LSNIGLATGVIGMILALPMLLLFLPYLIMAVVIYIALFMWNGYVLDRLSDDDIKNLFF
jgi:hypothetical protein